MQIEFDEHFFRNFFLALFFLVAAALIAHPEAIVAYGEPEEKVVDIFEKEALEPTRYGNSVVPKVVVLIDDKPVVYIVEDYTVFRKLPQDGEVRVLVQEKKINGEVKAGKILEVVED